MAVQYVYIPFYPGQYIPGVPARDLTDADLADMKPSLRREVEDPSDSSRRIYVPVGQIDETEQERLDRIAAEQAAYAAAKASRRVIYGREFDKINPATGQIAVGSATGPTLVTSPMAHAVHLDRIKRAKGGSIGLGGKSAIAFRVDHGVDDFLTTYWPLFKARDFPASIGLCPDSFDPAAVYEPQTKTWADVRNEAKYGLEIWSHSSTHRDPAVTGNSLEYEIVRSKQVIEQNNLVVCGWQMPGITPCNTPDYSNNFNSLTSWATPAGHMLLANYGLIENVGDVGGAMRALPTNGNLNHGHYTLDDITPAVATGLIDQAISLGLSLEVMFHPDFIATGTKPMTTAGLTTVLDHVKAKRDAGLLEVLTVSGLAFADPTHSRRLNLLVDGSFETQSGALSASTSPWKMGTATGASILTTGGRTGANFLRSPAGGFSYGFQDNNQIPNLLLTGQVMVVEGWARTDVAGTEARIIVADTQNSGLLTIEKRYALASANTWTKVRFHFAMPVGNTGSVQVRFNRAGGTGYVDWDDVGCYPA